MTEGIRIRVRTNFAQNSKSITHEQTVEIDAPVAWGKFGNNPKTVPLVEIEGEWVSLARAYERVLEEMREVAAHELEQRKLRFSAQVAA